MADKDFVVKNSLVVNTTFVVNSTAIYYGTGSTNAVINATSIVIGNATVNAAISGSILRVANSTSAANLTPGALSIGTTTVNSSSVALGSNVSFTAAQVTVGNSFINTTSASIGATATRTAIFVAANGNVGLGNTTPATPLRVEGASFFNGSGTFAGAVSGITTLAAGNTSITGWANSSVGFYIGGTRIADTTGNYATHLGSDASSLIARRADVHFIGTTSIALNRGSGSQTLTGVSIDGTATNITAHTINQSVGTANSPTFAGLTLTGTFIGKTNTGGTVANSNDVGSMSVRGDGGNAAVISFHRQGAYAINLGLDTDNQFKVGGWSAGSVAWPILHSGNFNSYAPGLTGANASGTWGINITGTATNITAHTINQSVGTGNVPTFAGLTINGDISAIRPASPSTGVIFLGNTGRYLYFDGSNYNMPLSNLYVNSQLALTLGNYNSYVPTLTGGNASGTWGINITGTSANIRDYTINQSVGTGNSPTFSTVYAQVFYDSNNSGYYVDPHNISVMNRIRFDSGNWNYSSDGYNRFLFSGADSTYIAGGVSGSYYIRMGHSGDYTTTILTGNGDFYTKGNVTAYWSDKRLKKNIEKITDWRHILFGLNGYRYEWNDIGKKIFEDGVEGEGVKVGLIAQEVKAVLPQAACVQQLQFESPGVPKEGLNVDIDDPYLTVREERLIPVLVEALKAAHERIDALEALIKKN